MPLDSNRQLVARAGIALAIGTVLVLVSYTWIDRPVAFYVHDHHWNKVEAFKRLTDPPPIVQAWAPLALALVAIRRAWGPVPRWQWALFVACASLILADQFRESLGDVCGRYWPETWHHNNPSLIGTGTYGFHPFQAGDDTGSFPSGHSARIAGFFGVWWFAFPRGRVLYALLAVPMLFALIAMDYHFVADVIAGTTLGGMVASFAAWFGGLLPDEPRPIAPSGRVAD